MDGVEYLAVLLFFFLTFVVFFVVVVVFAFLLIGVRFFCAEREIDKDSATSIIRYRFIYCIKAFL